MQHPILSYLFFILLAANVALFGYYNFFKSGDNSSEAVKNAQSQLKNSVNFTNVSSELPAQIGTKK